MNFNFRPDQINNFVNAKKSRRILKTVLCSISKIRLETGCSLKNCLIILMMCADPNTGNQQTGSFREKVSRWFSNYRSDYGLKVQMSG